ncbi:phosphoribosyl-ATP pyrophosphohydrolase [Rhodococcus ruber Chol-4]|uniref:nucleoside triphosphate pyrophosphohydrolase n=1 Tax=Rhodococcus TaxID=1827 RepID=UPI0003467987|nr:MULTISPECIES: nucleoside triphosphate pyrophosphohydrolase [Rhodococcus]MDO2381520.1 nucleoside triphosphate pyrophosphohydrolase [Rhodococcus ruber]RIK09987.1 MAG: phosphoribosyl-ATP pyrophosphohydrolase [Acidobacteriota bacterium]AWG99961.1 phosphoribosyl-ATP pyrophosphohydrolase [Rhodococcus ruber]AXY53183.1 phosphoribosyl-ATP pyrophosphohydrolase [Rhodococcus ruber]KXF84463.1 phosphoribosyl-ATP pyrophosphohydrolase [Rhodococcus ruber Chol-4]
MGKLVRDRIPEIIEADGRVAHTRILDRDEYRCALLDKLVEEAHELRHARGDDERLGELADMHEVFTAALSAFGITADEVVAAAAAKRAERGGFDRRIWLE